MGHELDNRLATHEELQLNRSLRYHKAGNHMGHIYLSAEESTRQALVNVVVASSDVTRMVNRRVALVAEGDLGEIVGRMNMKRRKQHHRHIDHQHHPSKQSLPAGNAVGWM